MKIWIVVFALLAPVCAYAQISNNSAGGSIASGTTGQNAVFTTATALGTLGGWINVKAYGAKGDTKVVTDANITSGLSSLTTSSSTSFTSADVGKNIYVVGAGAAGVTLVTTVATFVSSSNITLTATAGTTVTAAHAYWGTDDSTAVQNALNAASASCSPVYFPAAYYSVSNLTLNTCVSLYGEYPQSAYTAGTIPTVSTPAGGTWFNCESSICATGSNLYAVNMTNLGFSNFATYGLKLGSNGVIGISYSDWRNLSFFGAPFGGVGNPPGTPSDIAISLNNYVELGMEHIRANHVNTFIQGIAQNNYDSPCNSTWIDIAALLYAHSVANGNSAEPGIQFQVLAPASGNTPPFQYQNIFYAQVQFPSGGDHTGIGISLTGVSGSSNILGFALENIDLEGDYLNGISGDFVSSSKFSIRDISQPFGSANTVNFTANSSRNVVESTYNAVTVADANGNNLYFGQFNTAATNMNGFFQTNAGGTLLNANSAFTVSGAAGSLGALTARSITATGATSQVSNMQLGATDTNVSRVAANITGVGTGSGGSVAGYFRSANTCRITADVSLTVNTPNSFCSFSLPASAQAWSYFCDIQWAITAGSGTNTFALGVNASQTPTGTTNAEAQVYTATAGTNTMGSAAISASGATNILTGASYTPAATVQYAKISGTVLASASSGTFAITGSANGTTATAAVKAGSACYLF